MRFSGAKLWILFLVFSGTLVNGIDRSSLATANTFIAKDLHLNLITMGWALSAFGWTYLIGNLPAGWLADKFGVKKVYGIAALIWSVATAMTGVARGFGMLLFSRLFVGIGEAGNFPAATKVIAEQFQEAERGAATGIYLAGLRLGYALTPGVMVAAMMVYGTSAHPNWRIAFYLTGFGSLLWVVLWFLTYRDKKKTTVMEQPATIAEVEQKVPVVKLLKFRNTWAIVFIKFFQDYLYYLFLTWLPGYLSASRHLGLKYVAFYATLPWVAGMLVQPVIGVLSDKLVAKGHDVTKVKKTLIIVVQLISVSVIGAAFAHSALTAAWLLVLAMAAESASTAILWSIPADLAPKGTAGSMGGIMNTAGAVASIVSPALTGYIAQDFGFASALVLGGLMMVAAALSVLFFLTKIRPMEIE